MIWDKIHRYGILALAGAAFFGAGVSAGTANYAVPGLWEKAAQLVHVQTVTIPKLKATIKAKTGDEANQKAERPQPGCNCPERAGWRPPMLPL